MTPHYHCLVIGGGPAGSTTAALVSRAGFRTLLVEKEQVPRFHVGESLMPDSFWTLKRLGVLEELRSDSFARKVGVQFVGPSGNESRPFYFDDYDSRECSKTWHVERSKFDRILFGRAREYGAKCMDQTRVVHVELRDSPPHCIRLATDASSKLHVTADVVVDATGQQALLANQLDLRIPNPKLRKAAIWGHFDGGQRTGEEGCEVTIILHTRSKRCWFWYIPLAGGKISVGLVSDSDYLFRDKRSADEVFREELENCPGVERRLASATLSGKLNVAREFSYTTRQHAGDGWVLVGDAFGFIDPVYSTGVLLALKSGEMAADAIVAGFEKSDLSASQLGSWTGEFKTGVGLFRKLVEAFYTPEFSFADFIESFPHHRKNLTDLLLGRAFTPEASGLFEDLDPALKSAALVPSLV